MKGEICVAVEAAHLSVGDTSLIISAHLSTAFPPPGPRKGGGVAPSTSYLVSLHRRNVFPRTPTCPTLPPHPNLQPTPPGRLTSTPLQTPLGGLLASLRKDPPSSLPSSAVSCRWLHAATCARASNYSSDTHSLPSTPPASASMLATTQTARVVPGAPALEESPSHNHSPSPTVSSAVRTHPVPVRITSTPTTSTPSSAQKLAVRHSVPSSMHPKPSFAHSHPTLIPLELFLVEA